ncbi:hypothetical protein M3O57_18345 [Xanthomonas nasturtii]|uniref:ApeA N-terminal domain 1-containing protein n=1 Tax=Xanthomonas nasturtii TaxID=1843581 RepID=UPI0011C03C7C|nr:hypothetical protein [Xanthomonas nasturtii]MCL1532400.1 hypothetical protein [Xanthomonas nasturtii]MCL1567164.1 hypothetical protein [Xanthomonas nasturtii]MCL1570962.1 hypothetical protein [Xanthomonas nasturtii]MCL1574755.1 hypothetical protein [Xanthomonas nasturtii]MCL1582517.1 hypothetical protein [Xanthomonas nasturtii]
MSDSENTFLGRFWLPHKEEQSAVEGVLVLNRDGASLQLRDLLDEKNLDDSVIFARLQGRYSQATLFNCYSSWSRDSTGSALLSRASSTMVAMGCINKNLAGEAIGFRLPGSEKWLDEQCFKTSFGDEERNSSISFNHWEIHKTLLSNELFMERAYSASFSNETHGVESYTIIRLMQYRIISSRHLPLDDYWGLIFGLKRFFEFIMQTRLTYEKIELYDEAPISSYKPDIWIHHVESSLERRTEINRNEFLVQSRDLNGKVDDIIQKWMEFISDQPAPLLHYFHSFDRQRKDRVLHFVWNVAALEELHKIRFGRKGKNITLTGRIRSMCTRWKQVFTVIPNDITLENITVSRHYHAHAAGDLREKAAKGWHLFRYGDFLMALSNLEILSNLGLSQSEVIDLTKHNRWMSEALHLRTYPGGDE